MVRSTGEARRRHRRWGRITVGGLGVAGVAAAFVLLGGSPAESSNLEASLTLGTSEAHVALEALRDTAPQAQRAAFADGVIDLAEYEASVAGTIDCLEQGIGAVPVPAGSTSKLGVVVEGPKVSPDEFAVTYSYSLTMAGVNVTSYDPAAFTPVSNLEQRCQQENQWSIERGYQLGRLADSTYVQGVAESFESCASDAGISELGSDATEVTETLVDNRANDALGECITETPAVGSGLPLLRAVAE